MAWQSEPLQPASPSPSALPADPTSGACDHFQPGDLAKLAEAYLTARAVPAERWDGTRFRYGAGGGTGPFKAVLMEVERKKGDWVVVKLDRRREDLAPADAGFSVVRDTLHPGKT